MPPEHMGAIGYGQFHPLVANDTDEHRAKNRRVVFLVKNKPPKFDNGKKGKPDKEATSTEDSGQSSGDSNAEQQLSPQSSELRPGGEPAAETAVPLPAEVPAEQTSN